MDESTTTLTDDEIRTDQYSERGRGRRAGLGRHRRDRADRRRQRRHRRRRRRHGRFVAPRLDALRRAGRGSDLPRRALGARRSSSRATSPGASTTSCPRRTSSGSSAGRPSATRASGSCARAAAPRGDYPTDVSWRPPFKGMADVPRVVAEFDAGATIVLQALHVNWHPLAAFCRCSRPRSGAACRRTPTTRRAARRGCRPPRHARRLLPPGRGREALGSTSRCSSCR